MGGVCVAIYHVLKGEELADQLFTSDLDLGASAEYLKAKQEIVEEILASAGLEVKLAGRGGVTKFEWPEDPQGVFLVEILVPLSGSGEDPTMKLESGLKVPRLRYLDLLIESASLRRVSLAETTVECRLPDPGVFILHKLLTAPKRSSPPKKRKDFAYALDILYLYSEELETLAGQIKEISEVSHEYRRWIERALDNLEGRFQPDSDPLRYATDRLPDVDSTDGAALVEEFLAYVQDIRG